MYHYSRKQHTVEICEEVFSLLGKMRRKEPENRHVDNLNTMQRRRAIVKKLRPLLVLIILVPVITFMMYPMVNMEPRDIHVGIINLDKGAEFDQGSVNLGSKILDGILNPEEDEDADSDVAEDADSNEESPIIWEVYRDTEDAQNALDNKDIYAFLVIPKDFSEKQTAQLEAFNTLAEALDKMSEGTGKLGDAVDTMGSRLGKLPAAFNKMRQATSNLAKAAEGLQTANGMMGKEAQAISGATAAVQQDQVDLQGYLTDAEDALKALSDKDPSEITEEDIAAVQAALDSAKGVSSADGLQTIGTNSAMIAAQSGKVDEGLSGIKKAETTMSDGFGTMASNMGKAGAGAQKMSEAVGGISDGLGTMSGELDNRVSDVIKAMNGEETDSDTDEETVKLHFTIDQSRHVLVTSTLTSAINGLSAKSGMQVDIEYQNEIPTELNSMFFAVVFMMLTMFTSMIPGILTGITLQPKGPRSAKVKGLAFQIILAAAIALCLGFVLPRVIQWMAGVDLPLDELGRFVAISSFGLLMLIIGAVDLLGLPGVAFPAIIMFCGTAVANLPYEYLPQFWQKYIYPWEPLRFIADGIRNILYWGGSWWSEYSKGMLVLVVIGLCFMILSLIKKDKVKGTEEQAYAIPE